MTRIKIITLYDKKLQRKKTYDEIEIETNQFLENLYLSGHEIINVTPMTTHNNPMVETILIVYRLVGGFEKSKGEIR